MVRSFSFALSVNYVDDIINIPWTVNASIVLKSCRYIITNFTYLLIACNSLQTFQPRCLPCFLHPPLATTPSWFFPTIGGVRGEGQGEKGHTYLLASIATQWCKVDWVSIQFHFHISFISIYGISGSPTFGDDNRNDARKSI